MTTSHAPHERRLDVEGLRALAVAMVLLFHFFPATYSGGFFGVDVFFVISGYVVSASLLRQHANGTFRFRDFYERRVRRLFPALALVSFTTLVAAWALLFEAEFTQAGLEALLASAMGLNFNLAQSTGYFDEAAAASPYLHFWSLAVEEQFYLIWPAFLVLLWGARRPVRGLVLLATILASFAASLVVTPRWPDWAFYMLPTRAWEFALGGALAFYETSATIRNPRWGNAASVLGLGLVFGSFLAWGDRVVSPWYTAVPVLGTLLLICSPTSWLMRGVFATRPMTWVGARSYPIYLWHWMPVVFHLQWYSDEFPPSMAYSVSMIGLVVVIADLTYRFVERPFRAPAVPAYGVQRLVPAGLVAAMLAVGLLGAAIWQRQVPERMVWSRALLTARTDTAPTEQHLVLPGRVATTLFAFGDSYLETYIPELQRVSDEHRNELRIEILTRAGCGPLPLVNRRTQPHCLPFVDEALALARRPEVVRVLIAASWRNSLNRGDYFDPTSGRPVDPASTEGAYVLRALEGELATLVAMGKEVVLILNPPGGPLADPAWVTRHFTGQMQFLPLDAHDARVGEINELIGAMALRAGAKALDPRVWLCDARGCPVTTVDGAPIFADATHLRASYVRGHVTALDHLTRIDNRGERSTRHDRSRLP